MRIIFMGTPDFAVKSLETLNINYNVVAVVTAPDKKRGRGQKVIPTPVKEFATNAGLPVLQPTNLKDPEFIEILKSYNPDLNVVVAFRMLPEVVFNLPTHGSINLHASLLPDYRGAAPINHAIINGEKQTGVTTFFLDKKIDTGRIIMQHNVNIYPNDTAGTLHDKLMVTGASILSATVKEIEEGTAEAAPQIRKSDKSAPKIYKEDCEIDWSANGSVIHNFIRGLSPYPAAWTTFTRNGKPFTAKIYAGHFKRTNHEMAPGTVKVNENNLEVAVNKGWYEIKELQPQSKKRVTAEEFVRGLQKNDELKLAN
ncbi:methionyl-tRNA formyltransferase [Salinivirga cyanobacteriivorans]